MRCDERGVDYENKLNLVFFLDSRWLRGGSHYIVKAAILFLYRFCNTADLEQFQSLTVLLLEQLEIYSFQMGTTPAEYIL